MENELLMIILISLLIGVTFFALAWALIAPVKKRSSFTALKTGYKFNNPLKKMISNNKTFRSHSGDGHEIDQILAEIGDPRSADEYRLDTTYATILTVAIVEMFAILLVLVSFVAGIASPPIVFFLLIAIPAGVGAIVHLTSGRSAIESKKNKKSVAVNRNLYQLMERVASGLKSGKPVREAFVQAGPYITNPDVAKQVEITIGEMNSNVFFDRAMRNLALRSDEKKNSFTSMTKFTNMLIVAESSGTECSRNLIKDAMALRSNRARVIKERSAKVSLMVGLMGVGAFSPLFILAIAWPILHGQIFGVGA
jgi:Flp pilus assembly protein TadB